MNIVLFEENEIGTPLPLSDSRGKHIQNILKLKKDDAFDAGIINGGSGKAFIKEISDTHIIYSFNFLNNQEKTPGRKPLILITAFARPPEAKKILKNITTLGVSAICFIRTLKSEKSYMDSSLWNNGNYRQYLVDGASQAFATDIPDIHLFASLKLCADSPLIKQERERIALDNYEAVIPLTEYRFSLTASSEEKTVLAVGGERGWSTKEREILRDYSFTLCSLGERVLKTETACIAGISVIYSLKNLFTCPG